MGDEIGLLNDHSYLADPTRADDNRWMHRPPMDWGRAATADDPGTAAGRISLGLRRLIAIRRSLPAFHAAVPLEVVDLRDAALFGLVRRHPTQPVMAVHSFSPARRSVASGALRRLGFDTVVDVLEPTSRFGPDDPIPLPEYGVRWLVGGPDGDVAGG
jgi:amylosucrase